MTQSALELQQALEQKQVNQWAMARFTYACRLIERAAHHNERIQQQLNEKAYQTLLALWQQAPHANKEKTTQTATALNNDRIIIAIQQLTQSLSDETQPSEWDAKSDDTRTIYNKDNDDNAIKHNEQRLTQNVNQDTVLPRASYHLQ